MPRAPHKQRVVGRSAGREPLGVVEQDVAHAIDPDQQLERHAGHLRHRPQLLRLRLPHEGVGRREVGLGHGRRRQALDRGDETLQQAGQVRCHPAAGPPLGKSPPAG